MPAAPMFWTLFFSVLPGLVICYAMFRIDKYERESFGTLAVCAVAGGLLTFPAVWSEVWAAVLLGIEHKRTLLDTFVLAFGIVAPIEEALKWGVLLLVFPRRFFNEPLDGIVYAVMIGMGFATLENVAFAERFGPHSLALRALTAVPAHLVFAIVQGYYAGLAKFGPKADTESTSLLIKGFFYAFLLHALYDLFVFQDWWEWLFMLATASLYLCLFYCRYLIREHLENSPFRNR
jgi:protease PrsW